MRVAYVHGFAGVSGLGLLGALVDADVPLANVQETWQQLQLPAVQLTRHRHSVAGYTATCLSLQPPSLTAFLAPHTYASLCAFIEQQLPTERLAQRLLHVLTHFSNALIDPNADQSRDLVLQSDHLPMLLYTASGVAAGLEALSIDQVLAAPINLGADPDAITASLVRGATVYGERTADVLTTVDGAAILVALAADFGPLPMLTLNTTGHGAVRDGIENPRRGLQVMIGEVDAPVWGDRIAVLETNIDDMNPEFYDVIFEHAFAQGALDVTLTPILMKKGRPANRLTVLAPLSAVPRLSRLLLQETSTFGVRVYDVWRHKLDRFMRQVETRYGPIAVKCGVLEGRIVQAAPEYDACKHIAQSQGIAVRLVYTEAARLAAAWLADSAPPHSQSLPP